MPAPIIRAVLSLECFWGSVNHDIVLSDLFVVEIPESEPESISRLSSNPVLLLIINSACLSLSRSTLAQPKVEKWHYLIAAVNHQLE